MKTYHTCVNVWSLTNGVDSPETSPADRAVGPETNPQEVGGGENGSGQGAPTVPPYQRISLHSAITNLERKGGEEEVRGSFNGVNKNYDKQYLLNNYFSR